jgi:hypothetical protein
VLTSSAVLCFMLCAALIPVRVMHYGAGGLSVNFKAAQLSRQITLLNNHRCPASSAHLPIYDRIVYRATRCQIASTSIVLHPVNTGMCLLLGQCSSHEQAPVMSFVTI